MSAAATWKVPPRREYKPKPTDPGQRITWTVVIDGYWERPGYMDGDVYHGPTGKWIEAVEYERSGVIWSAATSASSWWVVPDDDPASPVVVRRAGKKPAPAPRGHSLSVRRVRGLAGGHPPGGVFAVVDREDTSRSWSGPGTTWKTLTWHSDPDCPAAAGKPRDDGSGCAHGRTGPGYGDWDMHSMVDVLTGRAQLASPPPFCSRCVMLEDAAESARELVTA